MNGIVIANEVNLYYWVAVSLRIRNDFFIGPFAIIIHESTNGKKFYPVGNWPFQPHRDACTPKFGTKYQDYKW